MVEKCTRCGEPMKAWEWEYGYNRNGTLKTFCYACFYNFPEEFTRCDDCGNTLYLDAKCRNEKCETGKTYKLAPKKPKKVITHKVCWLCEREFPIEKLDHMELCHECANP